MPFLITPGPGAAPFSPALHALLHAAVAARTTPPRTRHLLPGGGAQFTNRLALETSPYLLQHAHNPVDWRPWGEEAFATARAQDKPVFLSIGYATCHWCHVMEEESFEDEEIAALLNEKFICIKVDREERPDVDAVYMQAVQLMTQGGGWPMSVFLCPDQRPFFAGTYFPARDGQRGARLGLRTLVVELSRVFHEERGRVEASAEKITKAVEQSLKADAATGLPGLPSLEAALRHSASVFDPHEGGVRRAPKFPSSMNVRFLLRMAARTQADAPLSMATLTLEKMALGGLYDQVGGGFHRYSTDAQWLVPHFEKMLYDNALLAVAYVEAWQLLQGRAGAAPDDQPWTVKASFFRRIAEESCAYVGREMTTPEGAFWSATDADSEGQEGTFFVWTKLGLSDVLGAEDGERAARLFGARPEGNFDEEPGELGELAGHDAQNGRSVLSLQQIPEGDDRAFLDRVRPLLYAARAARTPPLTDTKVLAGWNGLMIAALARTGLVFDRPDLLDRARAAASFLLATHLRDGRLFRSSQGGRAQHPGMLEDYAFLASGLLDLFEATGEARWLQEALALHETLRAHFADPIGGFFRTSDDHERLLAREKPAYDGAEPTGNSVAALTLLRLAALTGDNRLRKEGEATLKAFGALLNGHPAALGEMLLAVDFALGPVREVALVRPAGASDRSLLDELVHGFSPRQVLARAEVGTAHAASAGLCALLRERGAIAGKATAYVCERQVCKLPVTTPEALRAQLDPHETD